MPVIATSIVCFSLLLLAGGLAAQYSPLALSNGLSGSLLLAALVLLRRRRCTGAAFGLLGFALFMLAGNAVVDARLSPRFAGDSLLTQVRVVDFPRVEGQLLTMLVEPVNDARLPRRSRVSWFEPAQLPAVGDLWQLELRLRPPRGSSNPGVFRLENWMFRENLHAGGYVVPGPRNRLLASGRLSALEGVRRRAYESLIAHGGESAPVLAAIGIGSRHLISRERWQRYALTGTGHLVAISGLHVGLAAAAAFGVVAAISGVLRLPGNHLRRAALGGLATAVAYAVVSGLAVPAQRASLMLGLAVLAFLRRRAVDHVRIVALTAAAVYCVNPLALMQPGFGLSFAAVAVLLRVARNYRPPSTRSLPASALDTVRRLFAMQIALLLGLMPLTVLFFQRVAWLGPAVNLVVVPIFGLVTVPSALLGMLLVPLGESAARLPLRVSAAGIGVVDAVVTRFAGLPGADVRIAGDGLGGLLILMPALWLVLPRGWPGRGVALLAALAVVLHQPARPPRGCFDLHVLDVGHGLAAVVETRRRTLLYDTGVAYRGGGSAAARIVVPFLRHRGIGAVDRLVVSHADGDHAGGLGDLAREIAVGRLYAGEALPGLARPAAACAAGQAWRADGIVFRMLHPPPGGFREGNDASCVLSIAAGRHRALLTGDIEADAERRLLRQPQFGPVDVVLIPHHGSLTSSTPGFVNRLSPAVAIASSGHANRWGFPKPRVTRRWAGVGARVLDTGASGAVSVRVCRSGGVVRLREQRRLERRFWYDSTTRN